MIADEIRAFAHFHVDAEQMDEFLALADRVAELESRPCPHVRTSGATSWCELARRDAEDAARLDWCMLKISGRAWREAGVYYAGECDRAGIDAAINKEQADANG